MGYKETVLKVYKLLRQRWLFSLGLLGLIAGLVLQVLGLHLAVKYTLGAVSVFESFPLMISMYDDIRHGTYGIDILAITAILASVALGQDWAAIVVVLMITGGESLEDYANNRARQELHALLEHAPQTAHLLRNGKVVEVKARDIKIGDKFIIKPGELAPADGLIVEGESSFDESSLTGESLPVVKKIDSNLMSGSVNMDGPVTAKAIASAADSQYQQIIKLVRAASESKAPFVRLADRYSIPFTLVAYAIAISVSLYFGQPIRFLEVIIVATPCPLLIATPIALLSGLSKSSHYGVIIKSGSALERLAETRTMAFDKTGTLTSGKLEVDKIKAYKGFTNDEVLSLSASVEQFSNHIIAKAITGEARKRHLKLQKLKKQQEISGQGLTGYLKAKKLVVGRLSLLEQEKVELPKDLDKETKDSTTIFVGLDGNLAGFITLKDSLRSEAHTTINQLRASGIANLMMITGDNQAVANSIAKQLGIDQVVANSLPADKLKAIEQVKNRPVAFVGDGVNDAPVLTAADVGIAMGARGSTAASESADIVIMLDDISRVAAAYKIAKNTFKIARQSILVGIGLSVALMLVFATGRFKPIYGAVLQEVVDILVIFNALRAHTLKLKAE